MVDDAQIARMYRELTDAIGHLTRPWRMLRSKSGSFANHRGGS